MHFGDAKKRHRAVIDGESMTVEKGLTVENLWRRESREKRVRCLSRKTATVGGKFLQILVRKTINKSKNNSFKVFTISVCLFAFYILRKRMFVH